MHVYLYEKDFVVDLKPLFYGRSSIQNRASYRRNCKRNPALHKYSFLMLFVIFAFSHIFQVAKAAEEAKNPKLITESLNWMGESVKEFGFRFVQITMFSRDSCMVTGQRETCTLTLCGWPILMLMRMCYCLVDIVVNNICDIIENNAIHVK